MLLAIETSCDETGVAIFPPDSLTPTVELLASQTKLHQQYGGVVPELAARQHVVNLPLLVQRGLTDANLGVEDLQTVAVTRGPGLMGCLLVGVSFAKALAFSRGIPLLALHHIEAHLAAGDLLPEAERPQYPCLALVVSGGHTMLVLMEAFRSYTVVAETRDDAAGEAFDKIATLLGLPYPGGPNLAKRAESGNPEAFSFPIAVPDDHSSFSFSGMKTAILREVTKIPESERSEGVVADLAASAQQAIVAALVEKSVHACRKYAPRSFLLTGGVAANQALRQSFTRELQELAIPFCVPAQKWCTDNAAMVGALAQRELGAYQEALAAWRRDPKGLGPGVDWQLGAVARWPLQEVSGYKN